tara:strand:+ start:8080 stop:8805 length:726 start_codon:yes stop_codon:yes gene_type:complete
MSIIFVNASSQYLQIFGEANTPDYNEAYTWMGWYYFTAPQAANHTLFSINNDDLSSEDRIRIDANENLRLYSEQVGVQDINGITIFAGLTTGWHFVAMRRSGVGNADLEVQVNAEAWSGGTNDQPWDRNRNPEMNLGVDRGGVSYLEGKCWNHIFFERALSDAEVTAFRLENYGSVTNDPWAYWNYTADALDGGAGSHDWTEFNTPTYESDPGGQVAWPGPDSSDQLRKPSFSVGVARIGL